MLGVWQWRLTAWWLCLVALAAGTPRRPYQSYSGEPQPQRAFYPGEDGQGPGAIPQGDDPPKPFYSGDAPPHGYQFSSFRGPVSGNIKEITVPYNPPPLAAFPLSPAGSVPQLSAQNHPSTSFDYVAKPDYAFTFGVQDPESGNAQTRQETRDGDAVHGEYRVMEPDGTLRTVTYSADPVRGFQAKVRYGPSGLPPPPPPTPSPTPGHTGVRQAQPQPKYTPRHRFKVSRPQGLPAHNNYDEYSEY